MMKPLGSAAASAAMAAFFYLAAGSAEGQVLPCSEPTCIQGDPYVYFPGANGADNFTLRGNAIFFPDSSAGNIFSFDGKIYISSYTDKPSNNRNAGPAGNVYGGIGDTGGVVVNNNEVYIIGGDVYDVYGGLVAYGILAPGAVVGVNENKVEITNGARVRNSVYGGRILSGSGSSVNVPASSNTVTVDGAHTVISNNIYGAYSVVNGTLTNNMVTIKDGQVSGGTIAGAYGFLSGINITDNKVNMTGGTVNARIFGGYAGSGGPVTSNEVTISGGTLVKAAAASSAVPVIYGGYSGGGSFGVDSNKVMVSGGGKVTADIYGGYSSSGSATNNTVTIGDSAVYSGSLWGGHVANSRNDRDAFSGNILNKNNASTVATARNFEYVNFGYTGLANIGTLYTTPTGSVRPGVILNTDANDVTFGGVITGTGSLTKNGTGTFILTGDSSIINGEVNIDKGTLQLGDGGKTGRITTTWFRLGDPEAVLAFNHFDDITVRPPIAGTGKVIQRGTGTLTLQSNDTNVYHYFSGGTEIESGSLRIVDDKSYGLAVAPDIGAGKAGHITFTGADKTGQEKHIEVKSVPLLVNSFRTINPPVGGGTNRKNYVDLTQAAALIKDEEVDITGYGTMIANINGGLQGGAFYVAPSTTMNVDTANALYLINNYADNQWNDLYVGSGGEFNLNLWSGEVNFFSGIGGGGTLNIIGKGNSPSYVNLWGHGYSDDSSSSFAMGTTNVYGDKQVILSLLPDANYDRRVTFSSGNFNLGNGNGDPLSAVLLGNGVVMAVSNGVNVNNGTLAPTRLTTKGEMQADTLTFMSTHITLDNFALLYMAYGPQAPLDTDDGGIPTSNNTLLYLYDLTHLDIRGDNNKVYFATADGLPFDNGDYLLIRTQGDHLIDYDNDIRNRWHAYVDGFDLSNTNSDGPRGGHGFKLGGDPNPPADALPGTPGPGDSNIWFGHTMNSLTMAWTGPGGNVNKARPGAWESGERFFSLQADAGKIHHERQFVTGDKVYIYGSDKLDIELPPATLTSKIVVSGLVAGQNMNDTLSPARGTYTIKGGGGITTDSASAFGEYILLDKKNPEYLDPTGKLEKFGQSTLILENTGGNSFKKGIDLHGGTVEFTQANQLCTGPLNQDDSLLCASGRGISTGITNFRGDSTLRLQSGKAVTLTNTINIESAVTGSLGAGRGAVLNYTGALTGAGSSILDKSGPGIVRLSESLSDFPGQMTVTAGTLDIIGDYSETTGFSVNGGTLSGTGTIGGAGIIASGGTLKPGDLEEPLNVIGDLTFARKSNFEVEVQFEVGNNKVKVENGTVAIDPEARLNVYAEMDYWKSPPNLGERITVIDASSSGIANDPEAQFTLNSSIRLPRGFYWEQGWDEATEKLFQLWLYYDPNNGYAAIPGGSHNQSEIGKNLDWFVVNRDPGLREIIDRFSDGWDDGQILNMIGQLTGDLAANAMFMALKEPWRHPFNRLASGSLNPDDGHKARFWAELTGRHEKFEHDGNAHGFTINRPGFALGLDYALSLQAVIGANFQYTKPRLGQETGSIRADNYEFGLYGLTSFEPGFDLKAYLGYSQQNYDLRRTVNLPASPHFANAFYEQLSGSTRGEALSASLELTRNIEWRDNIRLMPLAAFDYEKATMRGIEESDGQAALIYDDASMERLMFRVGLDSEIAFQNGFYLKPKAQLGLRLNDQKHPAVGVKFAKATLPGQPTADIWGVEIGGGYLGFGLGGGLNFGSNKSFYVNYETKIYDRATIQTGEAGFMIIW